MDKKHREKGDTYEFHAPGPHMAKAYPTEMSLSLLHLSVIVLYLKFFSTFQVGSSSCPPFYLCNPLVQRKLLFLVRFSSFQFFEIADSQIESFRSSPSDACALVLVSVDFYNDCKNLARSLTNFYCQ